MSSTVPTPPPLPNSAPSAFDFHALRYQREEHFFEVLDPQIKAAREKGTKLESRIEDQEEQFFQFLSHSVEIGHMDMMSQTLTTVCENIGGDLPMKLFLTEFPSCTGMVMPRFSYTEEDNALDEVIVLVSQHFLNDLNAAEQASILGHELGHALLGHFKVPTGAILEGGVEGASPDLLANVLRWSICREVSCDIFGYIAAGGDVKHCQTALLKFTTGLDAKTFNALDPEKMIAQVLNQYDSLADTVVESLISTHPLTPLRIKLLNTLPELGIIEKYRLEMNQGDIQSLRDHISQTLDPLVQHIYPELFEDSELDQGFILFYLGVATALADGEMDRDEVVAIKEMISPSIDSQAFFEGLEQTLQTRPTESVVEELVDRAVEEAKQKGFEKADATKTVKLLLVVAAADGKVDARELKAIFRFAENFDFTKKELVYLANQVMAPI